MESPFMGWIVPHEWQEPGPDDDNPDLEPEDWSDYDPESDFTV